MEIKPGKYKTRDRRQAVVLEVFDGMAFGRIKSAEDYWSATEWELNGAYHNNGQTSQADLVSEWEEPKPRLRVWRHQLTGGVFLLPAYELSIPKDWVPVPELDALFEVKHD